MAGKSIKRTKKTRSSPSSHFLHLKREWTKKHRKIQKKLIAKHKETIDWVQDSSRQLVAGSMASALMLAHPVSGTIIAQNITPPVEPIAEQPHTKQEFITHAKEVLPQQVDPLTSEQEQKIGEILSEYYKVSAKAELDGKRLNRSYGLIGAEQHLMRYPGDTIASHFATQEEATQFAASGMAPGRGAWGYFASEGGLTQRDVEREKYYLAVQTFLAPGWSERTSEYYGFFKYRKMLIVNPENGKAMVVVIGDAGPAPWTGKHLGGSPEVMRYLERVDGAAKGPVLYFFIDDPNDVIPLGPREVQ